MRPLRISKEGADGIGFAVAEGVILYDLSLKGFHTPLTREEIARHFHLGRIKHTDACKPVAKSGWQTVDELFPLLKYDSSVAGIGYFDEAPALNRSRVFVVVVIAMALLIVGIFAIRQSALLDSLHASDHSGPRGPIRATEIPAPIRIPAIASSQTYDPRVMSAQRAAPDRQRIEQERWAREQLQQEQAAAAEKMRAQTVRDAATRAQAAGRDVIVALDQDTPILVGGSQVDVRIHDNNVSSFDVWVNGAHYRDMQKQKGISHSGTDETLIYTKGSASLYYVWEISGELNHCILRVRGE
ncbi:MAG: hypothetical protein ABI839_07275 [Verrucomicrobiota bacterium]